MAVAVAEVQVDVDRRPRRRSSAVERGVLVEGDRRACSADGDAGERDVERVGVELAARLADRHRDAAPVRVAAEDSGLDQRRVRDSEGGELGVRVVGGAVHGHGDELGGALAVAGDHARERLARRRARPRRRRRTPGVSASIGVAAGGADRQSTHMSLVEVSDVDGDAVEGACRPPSASAASHASLVSGASVVMTASIVAMLGAIMPLPLAMPPTV